MESVSCNILKLLCLTPEMQPKGPNAAEIEQVE